MELQKSFKENVPSSRAFYIGGMNTVRGYYENFMAADGGFFLSTEYQVPITKDKKTSAYVFMDYGRLFGENRIGQPALCLSPCLRKKYMLTQLLLSR